MNKTIDSMKLKKHPNERGMGCTEHGFDVFDFHSSPKGLSMAEKTMKKVIAREIQPYWQQQEEPFGSSAGSIRAAVGQWLTTTAHVPCTKPFSLRKLPNLL